MAEYRTTAIADQHKLTGVDMDRWLSVNEIAEYLGVTTDSVYKWASKGQIPAHKVGRLWKFKVEEVDQWVREGKAATADGEQSE